MIELFACLGSGNSFKPWLALQQLGKPFKLCLVDVLNGQQKSPDFLAINPLGVVPFLVTSTGASIGESNAMLWYLAEDSPLMPTRAEERAQALQWMFFEQTKLEPFISPARFFTTLKPEERDLRASDIEIWQALAEPNLFRLDAHLESREFMLDSGYSLADIAIFGYVHVIAEAGLSLLDYPAISRWITAVEATKGFRPLAELSPAKIKAA
ncbi:Disulfide-bond oxidoreductase YfcG [Roseobacter fucihabitans]|uniref:Disulfide-bond oxidoreductase YfcG n=1 Tax=Roseobacter fucihabitans TaxID=1537242 RepID=A0ABZ2BR39_9RHOB|nr:glutathione S-transferase family protein [Roseobacter litoralis]MBC6965372.1 Disulfide-bond oxidoreductase YfcG [Roseobacter litoralis]MBC6965462.1 Disulfide-bond oxidoreductase YfcG [Roseobacter litoralis]